VDVLHHVAPPARARVLACAAALTAPRGHLAVKDHDRAFTPSYALAYAADRFVTGDRDVSFLSRAQLCRLVAALPGFGPLLISGVPPLRNNVLCLRQRHQPGPPGAASPDRSSPDRAPPDRGAGTGR
jgi:2-polyprenyl-6-hydroxyphenyl methylase/3-demethylubiquinone-9 3-methyltransferase